MSPPDEQQTTIVMVVEGMEVVVGRVDGRAPDLALVDALARMRLEARRRGWRLQLRDVPPALLGLLHLTGLDEVLACEGEPTEGGSGAASEAAAGSGRRLESGRKPELGEQLGEDEVVQPGDPPV